MLKRVVRKALKARRADQARTKRVTTEVKSTSPRPEASSTPSTASAPAADSIAARIAAGQTSARAPKVSATSGAEAQEQGLSSSEDGAVYWGDVDNESARSKGRGETLIIDQWECIACGTCVENTDAVFHLPDEAKAVVIQQTGDMALVQDAIDACPVTCIHWTSVPAEFEQLNDSNGDPA